MKYLLSALCLVMCVAGSAADYYVDVESRGGPCDDAGPGTMANPWRTLARSASGQEPAPGPGDTIWVRGGVYREEVKVAVGGAAGRPLTIKAFPDETPVIDGEGELSRGIVLPDAVAADHVNIEGLATRNLAPGGVGILAQQRTGIVLRGAEVSGARIGVWFGRCSGCKLLESEIHHNEGGNVLVDTGCSDIVIAIGAIKTGSWMSALYSWVTKRALRSAAQTAW